MRKKKSPPAPPKSTRPESDRRIRQADRLATVLRILELIRGNGRWNPTALAKELERSERTIHRHLRVLELAGVPYWFDKVDQSYRVRPEYSFPTLSLDDDELLGQAVASTLGSMAGLDISQGGKPTTRKLAAVSNQAAKSLLSEAQNLIRALDLKLADHSRHRDILYAIQWALLKKLQLTGQYSSPYEKGAKRLTLHPCRLCLVRQAWYLIARPNSESELKTYRVARFQSLRMLDAKADIPSVFSICDYFGNAWSVFRGSEDYDIQLRFSQGAARQVAETRWHHTQKFQQNRDGTVTLSFCVSGLNEILWWLLGWAGFVEVIEPAQLRRRFARQLEQGIAMNRS